MIGLVKTAMSKGVVGEVNARIMVKMPQTKPMNIPSFVPKTMAATITVIWMIVKLVIPIGINPRKGTIVCKIIIAVKMARMTRR
jgi:hypothetical protein